MILKKMRIIHILFGIILHKNAIHVDSAQSLEKRL